MYATHTDLANIHLVSILVPNIFTELPYFKCDRIVIIAKYRSISILSMTPTVFF